MLYHVKFHIDQQALGFDERRVAVRDAEAQRAREIREEGRLHGLWRRADGGGAIFVIEHDAFPLSKPR